MFVVVVAFVSTTTTTYYCTFPNLPLKGWEGGFISYSGKEGWEGGFISYSGKAAKILARGVWAFGWNLSFALWKLRLRLSALIRHCAGWRALPKALRGPLWF